jgi:hypothetical protein
MDHRTKKYLVSGSVGVVVGVLATIAAAMPTLLKLREQDRKEDALWSAMVVDRAAHLRDLRRLYALLSKDQLHALFPDDGETVLKMGHVPWGPDEWQTEELKVSPQGAYYLVCTGTFHPEVSEDFCATWLTREEAIRWAQLHVTIDQLQTAFSLEELGDLLNRAERQEANICHSSLGRSMSRSLQR